MVHYNVLQDEQQRVKGFDSQRREEGDLKPEGDH
jgi:hypothetical protein